MEKQFKLILIFLLFAMMVSIFALQSSSYSAKISNLNKTYTNSIGRNLQAMQTLFSGNCTDLGYFKICYFAIDDTTDFLGQIANVLKSVYNVLAKAFVLVISLLGLVLGTITFGLTTFAVLLDILAQFGAFGLFASFIIIAIILYEMVSFAFWLMKYLRGVNL